MFDFLERHNSANTVLSQDHEAFVIVIDAGHGGEDGGAIGKNGALEKDINLAIAKHVNLLLRSMGYRTVMTRTTDVLLYDKSSDYHGQKKVQDLATRRRIAEQYENSVFVSIHMNAFPIEKYHGLQVYYSPNHPDSKGLADFLQALTAHHLITDNTRKIKPSGGTSYLLDQLQSPAILVECGFLSNPEECEKLSEEIYQKKIALAIALSITEYFSQTSS